MPENDTSNSPNGTSFAPNIDMNGLAGISVLDETGAKVLFGSLYENQKTIVIFIRHFHCGMCKLYMEDLAKVTSRSLQEAGVHMIFVGCGEPSFIKGYRAETGFEGLGYADPTQTIYKHLGLMSSLRMGPGGDKRKTYLLKQNRWITVLSDVVSALKTPISSAMGKNGDISQLGGEFIFGPGNACTFAHRMEHTQDHAEVSEVMHAAGVEYP